MCTLKNLPGMNGVSRGTVNINSGSSTAAASLLHLSDFHLMLFIQIFVPGILVEFRVEN